MTTKLEISSGKTFIISSGKKLVIKQKTLEYVSPYSGTLTNSGTIFLDGTSSNPAKFKITS